MVLHYRGIVKSIPLQSWDEVSQAKLWALRLRASLGCGLHQNEVQQLGIEFIAIWPTGPKSCGMIWYDSVVPQVLGSVTAPPVCQALHHACMQAVMKRMFSDI